MSAAPSRLRRIAMALMAHATSTLPPARSVWAEAMSRELDHIANDVEAVTWAGGCVVASYVERSHVLGHRQEILMDASLLKRPSALMPVAMSVAALATVIGYAAMFGTARQEDEGTAAHVWQLLMAGQVPVVALFAIKWLPTAPRQALIVMALQVSAALVAMFPVWWFQW